MRGGERVGGYLIEHGFQLAVPGLAQVEAVAPQLLQRSQHPKQKGRRMPPLGLPGKGRPFCCLGPHPHLLPGTP